MKKFLVLFLILTVVAVSAVLVFAGSDGEDEELTIGVVIPYEIGWFTAFH
jgi:ABC-type sugar transport system substrate-binding protein